MANTQILLNQLIRTYSICTLFMFCKYMFCLVYGMNWNNHPAEDIKQFGDKPIPEDIKRRERTFLNDVENIPFHFVIFWGAYLLEVQLVGNGLGDEEGLALIILIVCYTLFRTLFTLFYILGLQPYRTIVFFLGNFTVGTAACIMVSCAFKCDFTKVKVG